MDDTQLETFLTVARYNNYSKAAEILNVTQPTVTARIRTLENELTCKLFSRKGKNITLTTEGKNFIENATNILSYIKHSKEVAKHSIYPEIKIGFSPGFSYSFITKLLESITINKLDLAIFEGEDSTSLNEQLLSGELDLVLTRNIMSHKPNLISNHLFDDTLILICGENHRLAKYKVVNLNDLEGETLICYRRHTPLWMEIEQQLIGIPNLKRIEVGNNEMLKQVVESGLGIGITPLLGVGPIDNRIVVKNIKEIESIPNKIYVQYKKNVLIEKPIKKIIYSIINHEIEKWKFEV